MMMHNGLTAWELTDLLTCRCRSRRCITCHISVLHNSPLDHPLALLLPTLSLSMLATILVFTIYILSPGAGARVIMSLRKFPRDPAPVSTWHWNIVYGTKIYFNYRQHSTFMLAAREDSHFKNLYCFQIDPCLVFSSCVNGWINKSKYY